MTAKPRRGTDALALKRGGATEPVDLEHLRRFTLANRVLEKEILELFLAQLPITVAALAAARSERDWKVAAHTIKGSSRAVGAWRLALAAEQAEGIPLERQQQDAHDVLISIGESAAEVRLFVETVYGPQ